MLAQLSQAAEILARARPWKRKVADYRPVARSTSRAWPVPIGSAKAYRLSSIGGCRRGPVRRLRRSAPSSPNPRAESFRAATALAAFAHAFRDASQVR
jgi:hypothetical protein